MRERMHGARRRSFPEYGEARSTAPAYGVAQPNALTSVLRCSQSLTEQWHPVPSVSQPYPDDQNIRSATLGGRS